MNNELNKTQKIELERLFSCEWKMEDEYQVPICFADGSKCSDSRERSCIYKVKTGEKYK